jgi:hypothetical protein
VTRIVLVVVLVAACGNARVITMTPAGGVIQLEGDQGKAREQAHYQMFAHCGAGNFLITYEGSEASDPDPTQAAPDPEARTPTTAYRIHFSCTNRRAPPPDPSSAP